MAVCVLASVIEALMEADLRTGGIADPDLDDQVISPAERCGSWAASAGSP